MIGTSEQSSESRGPLFSIVVPVYNVAAFLPAFLDSLEAQASPMTDSELIFVIDGSPDESGAIIRRWLERSVRFARRTRVIDQENQGLSGARNTGLSHAAGTWVTFPDPDDVLDPQYFGQVRTFLETSTTPPHLLCTHVLILDDKTGESRNVHPLHRKFARGTQLVNMEHNPEYIHLQAASGFYQRETIAQRGLLFDESIRPNFEDAFFTALYLSEFAEPQLGIAAEALYHYRHRLDGSSLVQRSWGQEGKYTTVLEYGYLRLLRTIKERRGAVPIWAQNTVLYDLLFYYRHEESTHGGTAVAQPAWTDRFHALAAEIFSYIDTSTIDAFSVMPTSRQLREALIIGYHRERTVPTVINLIRVDQDQQLVQIRYFFADDLPAEAFRATGVAVQPVYAKVRDLTYLNRVLLRERIVWLPATDEIRVSLNGRRMPLDFGPIPEPVYAARPNLIWRQLTRRRRAPVATRKSERTDLEPQSTGVRRVSRPQQLRRWVKTNLPTVAPLLARIPIPGRGANAALVPVASGPFTALDPRGDERLRRLARSQAVRERYGSAWTFIDRDTEAHDNAEHLYRYVRAEHPEVNAWFVLRRESGDWDRLAADGFRLVPFGSPDHVQLLLNTDHLISSQVDHYIVRPLDQLRFGRKAWRFTFLQHGVTKDDLSRWLNNKPISRFVTASPAEHQSIAGDHTPYTFTEKEVRLTGFPRHDRLLDLRRQVNRPDVIMIMPTWRRSLMREPEGGNARSLVRPLMETAFWRSWFDFIGSEDLRAVAERAGMEIIFMPHPNMQTHFSAADVPLWVKICTYDTTDVQELLARSAVTITDYSSQAFEAAYLEGAVVYYQFDQADFFGGTHVYRKGTWDYHTDGFGPVALDLATAIAAVDATVTRGGPGEPYLSRMRRAFPHHDGRCCERTYRSILGLTRPPGYKETHRPAVAVQESAAPVDAAADFPESLLAEEPTTVGRLLG